MNTKRASRTVSPKCVNRPVLHGDRFAEALGHLIAVAPSPPAPRLRAGRTLPEVSISEDRIDPRVKPRCPQ